MAVNLSMLAGAGFQFLDNNGDPLTGGKVYTYLAGSTTPVTTYTTNAGTTAHTNPIVLDAAGRVPSGGEIWLTNGVSHKFVVKTSTEVTIGTYDNILNNIGNVYSALSAPDGSSLVGYQPAGTGAVATTVQSKLRETVSVFDFMTAEQIADVQAGSASIDVTSAIQAAINQYGDIYIPEGVYLVSSAIQVLGRKRIRGAGSNKTVIKKTATTVETINGVVTISVLFVAGRYNKITDIGVSGEINSNNGIVFGTGSEGITSNSSLENVLVTECLRGLQDINGLYMTTFNNVVAQSCVNGFDFSVDVADTSLTFNSCWAENCGQPWMFRKTYYSVLNSCGADYGNYTSTGNPYGTGYGARDTYRGVYDISQSQITFNGCGAENSYGNGVFRLSDSCNVVLNNPFSNNCFSTYVPNYATYPNYGVGPIQFDGNISSLVVNAPRLTWQNATVQTSYPAKPYADLVAFNYNESTYGAKTQTMVTVTSTFFNSSSTIFAGMGSAEKYCRNIYSTYADPVVSAPIRYRPQNYNGGTQILNGQAVSQASVPVAGKLRLTFSTDNTTQLNKFFYAKLVVFAAYNNASFAQLNGSYSIEIQASCLTNGATSQATVTPAILYTKATSGSWTAITTANVTVSSVSGTSVVIDIANPGGAEYNYQVYLLNAHNCNSMTVSVV